MRLTVCGVWGHKQSARYVVASFISFVPPQAAELIHFAATPFPKKPYGFPGTPKRSLNPPFCFIYFRRSSIVLS